MPPAFGACGCLGCGSRCATSRPLRRVTRNTATEQDRTPDPSGTMAPGDQSQVRALARHRCGLDVGSRVAEVGSSAARPPAGTARELSYVVRAGDLPPCLAHTSAGAAASSYSGVIPVCLLTGAPVLVYCPDVLPSAVSLRPASSAGRRGPCDPPSNPALIHL